MADEPRVTTYSADEITLSLAGIAIDSGFATGEFLSIEMMEEDFKAKVGANGEVARSKTNNRMATVKVKLLQGSQGHSRLSALRASALDATNGLDVGAFLCKDRGGLAKAQGDKAWISKPPTMGFGVEAGEWEWTITVARCTLDPSGSPSV